MFVTKRYIEALKAQAGHAAQVISYLEFLADTNPDKLCEMIKSGEWKKRFGVKSAQQLPKEPDELSAETKMSIWLWGISMCAIGTVIGVVIVKLQL